MVTRKSSVHVGGTSKDDADWARWVAEGIMENADSEMKKHIESSARIAARRHAETSTVLGIDTRKLEKKLLGRKPVPRMTITRKR